MSLTDKPLLLRRAGLSIGMTNTSRALDGTKPDYSLSSQPPAFDEPIFPKYYDMDSQDTMSASKRVPSGSSIPQPPPRNALRMSRIFDNLGLKLGGAVEPAELAEATTPHDVYLSSEEDDSSDADVFSDYDYDSSVEDPASPTRRSSHEDTARVVSVVFAGKPSIIDLPATRKRPMSSSTMATQRTRSSTGLSTSPAPAAASAYPAPKDRPASPASTTSSRYSQHRLSREAGHARRSSLLSEILVKKKPPFLSIDPYANGSTYTLDIPKALDSLEHENQAAAAAARTPRTPTALFKGVTRSFSLARRRSRPNLSPPPAVDTTSNPNRSSVQTPASPVPEDQYNYPQQQQTQEPPQRPKTPMTPVTYNDILRAVKRNATVMGAPSPPSDIVSPTTPGAGPAPAKKGILSGLAVRRKSIKLTAKA
ncbi:hypothetical protein C8A05DRAFT_38338 [Staphylotrichum tortipilum]|uniref:Uncharacterized protein n=1 Tax=Staphylotrichum tortipilum TaxID=2831512 RepID=A0AAN6RPK1_9PEZI|nr:hypothetical protein C8A05DRAFT_38338 [Staphylotrichum longicolle]